MPTRDWRFRIEDIIEALNDIARLTTGISYNAFCSDTKTVKAVLYNVAVIGEAARHVPTDVRVRYPEISWREMSDMRNVVIHEYFGVYLEILWETIQHDLPPLVPLLQDTLHESPDPGV